MTFSRFHCTAGNFLIIRWRVSIVKFKKYRVPRPSASIVLVIDKLPLRWEIFFTVTLKFLTVRELAPIFFNVSPVYCFPIFFLFNPGLWIRIDLKRIRIQHCCSIRIDLIRICSGSGSKLKQNFRKQFLSQIFLKSKFESNQIKNTGVIHQIFFQQIVSAILYVFSGKIFLKNC
jgi:hypothetical protein